MLYNENSIQLYVYCLEEIKERIKILENILDEQFDIGDRIKVELFALCFRRIIEAIVFSSLVANEKEYRKITEKYQFEYRAKKIIENLKKINSKFFPVALKHKEKVSEGNWHFPLKEDGALTLDEAIDLWENCNKVIHFWSPFDPRERIILFKYRPREYLQKLKNLLEVHSIFLVGNRTVIVGEINFTEWKVNAFVGSSSE